VYSCGANESGQLGTGDTKFKLSPVKINIPTRIINLACGYFHTVVVAEDGSLWGFGNNSKGKLSLDNIAIATPTRIPHAEKFVSVSCGNQFTLALDENGTFSNDIAE
jgi:X-linked retinitis pigmentosa GTPase regulator